MSENWTSEENELANSASKIEATRPDKYRDDEQPECFCAYCGKPMRVYIGYDMADVQCENCHLTNATLFCTDIEELVNHMSMRPDSVLKLQAEIEKVEKLMESISLWFYKNQSSPDPMWKDEFIEVCQLLEPGNKEAEK
jgi:hypothetical protein